MIDEHKILMNNDEQLNKEVQITTKVKKWKKSFKKLVFDLHYRGVKTEYNDKQSWFYVFRIQVNLDFTLKVW